MLTGMKYTIGNTSGTQENGLSHEVFLGHSLQCSGMFLWGGMESLAPHLAEHPQDESADASEDSEDSASPVLRSRRI